MKDHAWLASKTTILRKKHVCHSNGFSPIWMNTVGDTQKNADEKCLNFYKTLDSY